MSSWRRWLRYGKAKLDDTVESIDRTLDRKEAELAADAEDRPWLADDDAVPTFDEAKARIDEATKDVPKGPTASGDPSFDLAQQQREADERLEEIKRSLGL